VPEVDLIAWASVPIRGAHTGCSPLPGGCREDRLVEMGRLSREGRFDHLLVESTGILEPVPAPEPRLGRRTVLTFPLLPPPQKN
jgi:CobW/HypB/UreG, nucleotide-binding domain